MTNPTCKNCKFWNARRIAMPRSISSCTRYPPAVVPYQCQEGVKTLWPITASHQSCGEHQPKPEPKPKKKRRTKKKVQP